jgi:signal-transduction protein with cAMP-binding, CBS, and nucleotidyltransferase domain
MQPPVTAVEQNDHAAAAAYLMKRAGATALIVTKMQTGQPAGIITEADISRAVADGKNPNDVRIYELMTANPTVVSTTASIRDAATIMTSKRFRHLPVMGDAGLAGIVDITDVCRALLQADVSGPPGGVIPAVLDPDGPCGPRCTRPQSSSMNMVSTAKPIGSVS